MNYDDFLGKVQAKARLAGPDDAVNATRAALTTLSERLFGGESDDLASQLPTEIARFVERTAHTQDDYDLEEFFRRVTEREGVRQSDAVHHVRAVLDVLQEAVTAGQIRHIRDQLPPEYQQLFEAGSEGQL